MAEMESKELEVVVGTYEELILGYRLSLEPDVCICLVYTTILLVSMRPRALSVHAQIARYEAFWGFLLRC